MSTVLPESHADLLNRPLFAHLATIRPDGSPQSSVMWFSWDGQLACFSHTSTRRKYRNLLADGRVSFHVQDPEIRTGLLRFEVRSCRWTPIRMPLSTAAFSDAMAPRESLSLTQRFVW